MKPAWKQILPAFVLGLVFGAALGSWAHRTAVRRFAGDGHASKRMLEKFSKELKLDAGQKEAVRVILESRRDEMKAFRQETHKKFDALRLAMHADIKKILTPEQQTRFAGMAARWESPRKRRWDKEE